MVHCGVEAKHAAATGRDVPGELWRGVVQNHDIDGPPFETPGELRKKPESRFEAVPPGGVRLPVQEDTDIDVALAVTPPFGLAAEEVGGCQPRNSAMLEPLGDVGCCVWSVHGAESITAPRQAALVPGSTTICPRRTFTPTRSSPTLASCRHRYSACASRVILPSIRPSERAAWQRSVA